MSLTLRDPAAQCTLTGRAEVTRERLKPSHDAGTRIGTSQHVARTARELTGVGVPRFAEFATVELLEPVLKGGEPAEGRARAAPHGCQRRPAGLAPPPFG